MTERAAEVLTLLEKTDGKAADGEALLDELPLFAAAAQIRPRPRTGGARLRPLEQALAAVNPDELTPKAALEALYKLKDLARKDRG